MNISALLLISMNHSDHENYIFCFTRKLINHHGKNNNERTKKKKNKIREKRGWDFDEINISGVRLSNLQVNINEKNADY